MRELTTLTAVDAVAAMTRGDITAEAYAGALLDRAVALESLNAFRCLQPDTVLEQARAADKARAAGKPLGAMHGLPIPVKDSVNTAAYPTTNGTAALREFRPKTDAPIVRSLTSAGAIVMGKTNLHELSMGFTSTNYTFGAVRNPYDLTRIPGGSSGGSGAAVAARMAPLAVAEDTMGSIRIPATMNGICGLRPTYARYSDDGIMPLTIDKFDQVGPLARSVEDLALFDRVVTGETDALPHVALAGVRLGVPEFFVANVHPDVARIMTSALDRLQDAGAVIVRVDFSAVLKGVPDVGLGLIVTEYHQAISDFLIQFETGITWEELTSAAAPDLQGLFATFPPQSPEVHEALLAQRQAMVQAVRDHFAEHRIDALVYPPAMMAAHRIDEDGSMVVNGETLPITTILGRNVSLGSVASLASLVLPAGLTPGGLPVGLEFDALPGRDRWLLALGLELERVLGPVPAPNV